MTREERNSAESSPWIDVNEIKRQVPIEAVLQHFGLLDKLKGRGAQLTGHSPFREDSRPSFSVNLDRGVWNDLGGRPTGPDGREVPGNVVGLMMAFERCSFRDALVLLQEKFIGSVNEEEVAAQEMRGQTQEALRNEETEVTENTPFGQELRGLRTAGIRYFEDKGITEKTMKTFGTGYCSRGLMKSRVVFPIRNVKDEIMAYAGRAVRDDQEESGGKYRFPSGFKKHLELFNIDRIAQDAETRKAVKDFGIILVEGFADVMRVHQNGFPNVVGLMGTDFHEAQKKMLTDPELNPTRRITIFLDNNEAGQKGRREIAKALICDAFLGYVDYSRVPKGEFVEHPTEPEHFTKDELKRLLSHAH